MSKRWARTWVSFLLLLGALCHSAHARYADPKGRFSIDMPQGWATRSAGDALGTVMAISPDGRAKIIVLPVAVAATDELAAIAKGYEEFLASTQKGMTLKLVGEAQVTLAGRPALQREYTASDAAGEGRIVSTFLKTGVLSLTLHTSVRGKDRDTYAPVLTRAVQSLTLGGAGGDDAIRAKLKALESARQAGILSDAEYQAKKAELEATLKPPAPKIDGPTREKLAALDAALAAGILTKAEYEQKKAALLGGAAPTPTRPVIPAPPPTVPVIPAPPPTAPAMKPYADPQQRFTVQFPAGWTAQAFPNNQGVAFMHGQRAVSVLLVGGAGTTQQIVTGIAANLAGQWKGYRQTARPPRTVCGQASPAVSFSGTNPQGLIADGELTALVAGGRGYVLILTVPQGQLSAVEAGWKALLASLSPGGAAAPVVPAVPAAEPEAGWKTYRHATGVSLRHPPDWRVQEQNGYPMLIPPDAATENGAPTEIYFAFGESLAGQNIQRTDDPKLLQYLDGQIKSLSPALNRVGAVAPIPVPGRAAATADWEATAQGKTVRARTYVTLINDHVLAIVAMGVREQIATRDAILRRIFATLQFGAAGGGAAVPGGAASGAATASVGDARLLGVWLHEKNFSSGRYSSVDVKTYVFRPDGTFANRGQFVANLEHGDGLGGNEDAGRTTLGADPNQAVGRWQAANGVLTLTWTGGGSEQVRYYIEDPSQPGTTAAVMKKRVMLVTTAEGQKQLWTHQK